jgi:hypothetical protein
VLGFLILSLCGALLGGLLIGAAWWVQIFSGRLIFALGATGGLIGWLRGAGAAAKFPRSKPSCRVVYVTSRQDVDVDDQWRKLPERLPDRIRRRMDSIDGALR